MYSLSDLWQSILTAFIRFWDNRFHLKTDTYFEFIKMQLEMERAEKSKLLNVIRDISIPSMRDGEEEEKELPKPIGVPNWRTKARELEAQQREKAKQLRQEFEDKKLKPIQAQTAEELEQELGLDNVTN